MPKKSEDLTHQEIDDEIAQLERRIITLKTTRNTLAPFSRLHDEIIQDIFLLASRGSKGKVVGRVALKLTWICHNWRELACQTPPLWSYIHFTNPPWIQLALSRTGNYPLRFDLRFSSSSETLENSVMSMCLQSLPRAELLRLDFSDDEHLYTHPTSQWLSPAPLLTELDLECVVLPPNAFLGILPSLQRLSLTTCQLDWSRFSIGPGLKVLSIASPQPMIPVKEVIRILQVIGLEVESLSFTDSFRQRKTVETLAQPRVELPNIKNLFIEDSSAPPVTTLFNHISIPASFNRISLEVWDKPQRLLDMTGALIACRNMTKWPVTSLALDVDKEYVTIDITEEDSVSSRTKSIVLTLQITDFSEVISIFNLLPLSSLRTFTLSGVYDGSHISPLMTSLNRDGTLTEINVQNTCIWAFTTFLIPQVGQLRKFHKAGKLDEATKLQCRSVIQLHQLTTLRVYVDNSEEEDEDEDGDEGNANAARGNPDRKSYSSMDLDFLAEWLEWRSASGLRLSNMVFDQILLPVHAEMDTYFGSIVGHLDIRPMEE